MNLVRLCIARGQRNLPAKTNDRAYLVPFTPTESMSSESIFVNLGRVKRTRIKKVKSFQFAPFLWPEES